MIRLALRFLYRLHVSHLLFSYPRGSYCTDGKYMCEFFEDWHCRVTGSDIVFGRTTRMPMKDKYGCPFRGKEVKR